jgi:hypothetical protein
LGLGIVVCCSVEFNAHSVKALSTIGLGLCLLDGWFS